MSWVRSFYGSSIGKKFVVASTGAIMILFLIGHMLGNLQVFEGRGPTVETTRLNQYAHLLRLEMPLLWTIRLVLLAAVILHVWTTIQLWLENRAARPEGYSNKQSVQSTLYSRTMIYGGLALFTYLVYHILHFTVGAVHKGLLEHGDVYGNVVRSFRVPAISVVYIVAQVFLYMHLRHGFQSLFRTLGVSHPRYVAMLERLGLVVALVITLGFIAVPLAVLFHCPEVTP
jgi:succinate dehydrogenase / fumarate reductase cytochrome b subunit